jgi:hypothetical protein
MRQEEQRKFDSFVRVRDFMDRNPGLVGPIATSAAAKQVDEAIAQIRAHITAQGATALVVYGQTGRIHGMAKNLVRSHLGPIAKFARATFKGVPEYATLATTGVARAPKRLVSHAYAVVKAAAPYLEAMTAAGFPADIVDQLLAATNELNDTIVKREPLASGRVQSTESIATLIELGRDGVRKIDAVLAKRLTSDEPALAAWKSASRVQSKVGAIRKPALMEDVTIKPETSKPPVPPGDTDTAK